MEKEPLPPPSEEIIEMALIIASVIRSTMEDFHVQYLSDPQMKELNPIIRNAAYTALYALKHCSKNALCKNYIEFSRLLIPRYWEPPELLPDFLELLRGDETR